VSRRRVLGCLGVGVHGDPAAGERAARQRHEPGLHAAHVEAVLEREAHVPALVQIAHDVAVVHHRVVRGERGGGRVALLQPAEDRARGVDAGLDGVVDALEGRDLDEAGRVAEDHDAVAAAPFGQRVVAALGDRLRAPLDQFAAFEIRPEQRVQLQLLEQRVHVEARVVVVEADHEPERDDIRLERVHEAAAERVVREGPADGVDDGVERLLRLPDLLHAERVDLRVREPIRCHCWYAWASEPRSLPPAP
jgi:hypothetical protein